ncbi:MAG: hypothetical protein U5O39_05060 [Gammaproteobacteria bacterium]|nr:hypothetical protein [Gammaproteobacteria bacterium]
MMVRTFPDDFGCVARASRRLALGKKLTGVGIFDGDPGTAHRRADEFRPPADCPYMDPGLCGHSVVRKGG